MKTKKYSTDQDFNKLHKFFAQTWHCTHLEICKKRTLRDMNFNFLDDIAYYPGNIICSRLA